MDEKVPNGDTSGGSRLTPLGASRGTRAGLSPRELWKRDANAVAYSKSALNEGDTMVFISYPNNKCFDATGFPLTNGCHRVNSENLLALGSTKFKDLLGDWPQHRVRKRKGYLSALPPGVKYILDLTPADEGDEAVYLTAELSCSTGIRYWCTAATRCRIAHSLVGGRDEVSSGLLSQPHIEIENAEMLADKLANSKADASSSTDGDEASVVSLTKDYHVEISKGRNSDGSNRKIYRGIRQRELGRRLENLEAKRFEHLVAVPSPELATQLLNLLPTPAANLARVNPEEVLEYCPIRHRAGIERLLQIIEKKDPRLDSAPKVWTLFVLSKYFGCTGVVTDFIFTWMMAEPNTKFIEILPEVSFRIGIGLQNGTITRAAFAILVAEEALHIAGQQNSYNRQQDSKKRRTTKFRRVREDIDEDSLNSIQHAGQDFHDRIQKVFAELVDERMLWLEQLPEYLKISRFEDHLRNRSDRSDNPKKRRDDIAKLRYELRHYVRGHITHCSTKGLDMDMNEVANSHREAEQYLEPYDDDFQNIYGRCSEGERILTRFFWQTLLRMNWSTSYSSNHTPEGSDPGADPALGGNIERVTTEQIKLSRNSLNLAIFHALVYQGYTTGYLHPEAFSYPEAFSIPETLSRPECPTSGALGDWWDAEAEDIAVYDGKVEEPKRTSLEATIKLAAETKAGQGVAQSPGEGSCASAEKIKNYQIPILPDDNFIRADSPYFSTRVLFNQAAAHVDRLCRKMLDRGELDFAELTDTIVCLGDEEWKYLPLWAGGNEDGSGGVYERVIPEPPPGARPNGPGPSFHTGYSVDSRSSSVIDFDGSSSVFNGVGSANTSIGVPRSFDYQGDSQRFLQSRDGAQSEAFSDDSEDYVGKGKGKVVDRSATIGSESSFDVVSEHRSDDASDLGTEHAFEDPSQSIYVLGKESSPKASAIHQSQDQAVANKSADLESEDEFSNNSEDEAFDFGYEPEQMGVF